VQQPQTRIEKERIGEMPTLIVSPLTRGEYPVVVALHGLTGSKETMLPLAQPLAAAGYVVACPDARFHGDRLDPAWMQFLQVRETEAVIRCIGETAAELPELVDALLARRDTRGSSGSGSGGAVNGVGIMGVSLGALTLYDAVPREPRFRVAASLIGGGIFPRDPQVIERMDDATRKDFAERDIRNHLGAFAGVALLLLAGADDTRLPAAATQALHDALTPQVRDRSRLRLAIEPGIGHEVTMPMGAETVAWFRRFLT